MPRYFTLAEARQHLPAVSSAIREGMDAKKVLDAVEKDHRAMVERIMFAGGMAVNHESAIMIRAKREASSVILKRVIATLEEIGCLVKDLDIGLIDFPALYRKKEVYLCWKFGEPDIEFWHPTDTGFAGRRPIDREFLRECGGDAE
jgi:hypothetical protein